MKLHVFPLSPNSRKVMMANTLLGLNLPLVHVDLRSGAQKAPEFLKLNPNGKLPVLEMDDGSTLWESNVIVDKLAAIAKSDLWPQDDSRYEILRWQFWESAHWTPACSKFIARHIFGNQDIDMVAAGADFQRFAAVLDGHLQGRSWLVGDRISTADIVVGAPMCLRVPCHYPLDGFANIAAWSARLESLPAWKAVDAAMEPA